MAKTSKHNVFVTKLNRFVTKEMKKKRQGYSGLFFPDGTKTYPPGAILVDPRCSERGFLTTLIHEILHRHCPGWSETKVNKRSREISAIIWSHGYRKEF